MAKDRIDRNELADKLVETAQVANDPLRAMAEILTDFLMEAEVTASLRRVGRRYVPEVPVEEEVQAAVGPGMDKARPPRLK